MEDQGLSQGSLRNSHRETHAVRRKPAPAKLQQGAYTLVESCSQDLIIRQRLNPETMEPVLKKGQFYVLPSTGRGTPGFLVFQPRQPAVFLQLRKGARPQGWTLRLRVSEAVAERGGSVLIATLDDVLHSLRLEDVWMWRGEAMYQSADYSVRREKLKEFVEHHWVPDARLLGGIVTTVAEPMTMAEFAAKKDWNQVAQIEFVPEQRGRRRMTWALEEVQRAATGPAAEKKFRSPAASGGQILPRAAPVAAAAASPVAQTTRVAKAVPVDKMPDVYDLFDSAGLPISRASVQQFALSQQLKAAKGELWVQARWRPEFGGYEIASIVPAPSA